MTKTYRVLLVDDEEIEYKLLSERFSKLTHSAINLVYAADINRAVDLLGDSDFDLLLVDNRLAKGEDFRHNVPRLRKTGYVGPIGVISSDLAGPHFDRFEDYGADFRMSKDELDWRSIQFLLDEYSSRSTLKDLDENS